MTIEFTIATKNEIPALCELLELLFELECEFRPNAVAQQRGLKAIIGNADIGCVLIARDGQIPVGMVSLLYTQSTALGGRVALLEDLIVAPLYRNNGIGSSLLEYAISHAKDNDCLRITLLTDSHNLAAQSLYKRQGFVLSSMLPMRLFLN